MYSIIPTTAIVRKPGRNFADGITEASLGRPDYDKALRQHSAYCDAITGCGLKVIVLEADERYPDCCFVEDTAVVTDRMAVITRPGAESRRGEELRIAEVLSEFRKLERIEPPGTLDGGDILRVNDHFYIGISGRTNREGAAQLAAILSRYGYTSSEEEVRHGVHLKSGLAYPGNNTFICISAYSDISKSAEYIILDENESYSANCLRINDFLLIPGGFHESRSKILSFGFNIIELNMSEFRKMDGGLTCLSLVFGASS